jgi:hypothetical protein
MVGSDAWIPLIVVLIRLIWTWPGVFYSLSSSIGISTVVRSCQLRFSTKAELEAAHCVVDSPPPCRRQDMRATLALASQFYSRIFCTFPSLLQVACECLVVSLKNLSFFDNGTERAAWVNDVEESVNVRMLSRVSARMSHPSHFISFVFDVFLSCSLCWSLGHRTPYDILLCPICSAKMASLLSITRARTLAHTNARTYTRSHTQARTCARAHTHTHTRTTIDTRWTVAHSILQVWVVNVFSINGDPEVRRLTRDFAAYSERKKKGGWVWVSFKNRGWDRWVGLKGKWNHPTRLDIIMIYIYLTI